LHNPDAGEMTTTLLMRADAFPRREAAERALRDAGVGVVEVGNWDEAAEKLRECEAALVIGSDDLERLDTARITRALNELAGAQAKQGLAHDQARALSHALRTPLSAMAGWVHLIETGKLDEAGLRKAANKLRNNIDDQVKTIELYLGANRQEGRG
jgi:signal transduction histidine kinase